MSFLDVGKCICHIVCQISSMKDLKRQSSRSRMFKVQGYPVTESPPKFIFLDVTRISHIRRKGQMNYELVGIERI